MTDPAATWFVAPVQRCVLLWGRELRRNTPRKCNHCGIELLTGEISGFCCGKNGSKRDIVQPLPPLPPEYSTFLTAPRISFLSRQLNLIYSFAQMESTHEFPSFSGPQGHFAVAGRIFHRVRPEHHDSAVRWLLYDGYQPESAPFQHCSWFRDIPVAWRDALGKALLRVNPLVHYINVYRQSPVNDGVHRVSLVMKDSGANEIAAVMCLENTIHSDLKHRSVVISRKPVPQPGFTDTLERSPQKDQSVTSLNRFWEPLAYPLLFPHGTLGWGVTSAADIGVEVPGDDDAPTSLMWHVRAYVLREPRFHIFGRLGAEYICDMFTRRIESDLRFIRKSLEARRGDAELMGADYVPPSENIYLPQSFIGSMAWSSAQIADSLTLAANAGPPSLFMTATCNPQWREIQEKLLPGQSWIDIPIVVARVFKQKLTMLLAALRKMFPNAGKVVYEVYSIEFQKRGLPHAHILIKYERDCVTPEDIDCVVSAELPDDAEDRERVLRLMTHNHPWTRDKDGKSVQTIPGYCSRAARTTADAPAGNGTPTVVCRFDFPKTLCNHTTVGFDGRVQYRRRNVGDEWVVPYNIQLLRAFDCHINVEVANSSHLFQYLFKYVHKGPDRARVRLTDSGERPLVDEIAEYWSARYLSAGEAAWRTLGYNISRKSPGVSQLPVHLPESVKHRQFARIRKATSTLSLLDRYFYRPTGSFVHDGADRTFDALTYSEFYTLFRHAKFEPDKVGRSNVFVEFNFPPEETPFLVMRRTAATAHYTRVQSKRPSSGEVFYLRALLLARPARSFEEVRTVDRVLHGTFQDAARDLGLFADKHEGEYALREGIVALRTPAQLRQLLVDILIHDPGQVDYPKRLWELFRDDLSKDHYYWNSGHRDQAYSLALEHIGNALEEHGRNLAHFGLPQPEVRAGEVAFELARWARHSEALGRAAEAACAQFTEEQRAIYNEIVQAVQNRLPLLMYIDGKAGRGKTFLINAVCNYIRSLQMIVLPTASSAFAAQNYPGGRTTHATFKVPVDERCELLRSPIEPHDSRGQLIREAAGFVWDEVPMCNRAVFACVDDCCKRVTGVERPFGDKVTLLAGDFRQTCPVVRRGTAAQVVDASIRRSPLFSQFQVRRLTVPIRNAEDPEFAAWVDSIGDGAGPQVDVSFLESVGTAADLINFVFPPDILQNPAACLKRSILCPTNAQIDTYNAVIISRIDGMSKTYYAADCVKEADDADASEEDTATLDYAARTTIPGVPAHTLTIKTNAVYRLMRNFSISRGLVKNVRVLVMDVGTRIVTVRLLRDLPDGVVVDDEDLLIPRITFEVFIPETQRTLQRRQFPLAPAYATTFNSCQGLTLDVVGMDLTRPVFSHGQLYTAVSRVRRRQLVRIRLPPGHSSTLNVVYRDILL